MSNTTLPAIGDNFTYSTIVSKGLEKHRHFAPAGHRKIDMTRSGAPIRECDNGTPRSCPLCHDQWENITSTVTAVMEFMDNSIEVHLADGTRRTVTPPSGDIC